MYVCIQVKSLDYGGGVSGLCTLLTKCDIRHFNIRCWSSLCGHNALCVRYQALGLVVTQYDLTAAEPGTDNLTLDVGILTLRQKYPSNLTSGEMLSHPGG